MKRLYCVLLLILSLPAAIAAVAESKTTLQRDPFKKPASLQAQTSPAVVNVDSPAEPSISDSKLTAVLHAGSNSMVILDGKTLRLGDVYAGYRLLDINERSAVFGKNKKQLILKIDKMDTATSP